MFETKEGIIKPIVYVGMVQDNKILLVDYVNSPNPSKSGWWIPAPGLEFGDDPTAKAKSVLIDFGFSDQHLHLKGVESFVLPGGWHLIYHFVCSVNKNFQSNQNIKNHKWVTAQELEDMKDLAHGKWEARVGKAMISFWTTTQSLTTSLLDDLKCNPHSQ